MKFLKFILPVLALLFPVFALAGTQTFRSSGTFTVPAGVTLVHVLVVGGGGGGGADRAGGGGGGGFIENASYPVIPGDSIPVTVGAGGAGGAPYAIFIANGTSGTGYQGGNSAFGTLTAIGGGAGRGPDNTSADNLRLNGGSGGGGSGDMEPPGVGICTQGHDGGLGILVANDRRLGAGGGGAGAPGGNATGGAAGNGGDGLTSSITGSPVTYAGGGGGGQLYCLGVDGAGGAGGGAAGNCSYNSYYTEGTAGSGAPNTGGGGGGGGGWNPAGSGGSGIVVVAWNESGSVSVATPSANSCSVPVEPPSCSVTFDQNPLTGESTAMHWTSTGADLFYINNVGWVGASGSAQVSQTGDYSGTVSGAGGTASCSATLSSPSSSSNSCSTGSGIGSQSGTQTSPGGTQTYSTPGTYTFTVPQYTGALTVAVNGAGGGGGGGGGNSDDSCGGGQGGRCGYNGGNGTDGGLSSFGDSLIAYGGTHGTGGGGGASTGLYVAGPAGSAGAPGSEIGGTNNADGGGSGGGGGSAGSGGTGLIGGGPGGAGGFGGQTSKTYSSGQLGATVSVVVGQGGAGGNGGSGWGGWHSSNGGPGEAGTDGSVTVDWTGGSGSTNSGTGSSPQSSGTLTCNSDGNLTDSCGNTTVCQYGCSTTTNQCRTRATCVPFNVCNAAGTKVVNICDGAVVTDCSAQGLYCAAGQCIPPALGFLSFAAFDGNGNPFTATGHVQASPSLLRQGDTSRIYWNVSNAKNCTMTGSNGDVWSTLFSGAHGMTTSPIMGQTTYTLLCTALQGATPPSVQESVTINILPVFNER